MRVRAVSKLRWDVILVASYVPFFGGVLIWVLVWLRLGSVWLGDSWLVMQWGSCLVFSG